MMLPTQEPPMPLIVEHCALSSMTVMYVVGLIGAWQRSGILADFSW